MKERKRKKKRGRRRGTETWTRTERKDPSSPSRFYELGARVDLEGVSG